MGRDSERRKELQKAEYRNRKDGMETGRTEEEISTVGTAAREKREEGKRKRRRLSSQKQAEADERMWKAGGKARNRSGREEAEKKGSTGGTAVGAKPGGMKGNEQKAKYQKPERRHGKPGGREGGKQGSRKEEPKHWRSHCEAGTGRRERKSRGLSSQNRKVGGRKKAGPKGKRPKAKAEGKHSWNSCGSEARKDERKRTASRVREPGRKA